MSDLVGIVLSINKFLLKNIIKNILKVKCYLELLNINLKNIFYIIIISAFAIYLTVYNISKMI